MPKNIMEVGRLEKELANEREKTREARELCMEAREICMELFEVAKDVARERDELRMKAYLEVWKVAMKRAEERRYKIKITKMHNLYKACELMQ